MTGLMLSLLILYVAITTLHAQPQYRVVVDTPITVLATGGAVQPTHVTVCFRERTSESDDLDYCPLGQLTLPADNTANGPPQTLNLGSGADNLNPEYPSENPRIGLLISATNNGALLGFERLSPLDILLPLGTLANTGFRDIDNILVNLRLGVECAPGFTGSECNTPVITTSTEGTTTEGDTTDGDNTDGTTTEGTTTVGTTTEGDTIGTTTEGTTESGAMFTRSTVSSFSIHAPSLGIGLLIGVLLATVLTLLVNNMAICWCLRRQRRKAGQRRNKQANEDDIELNKNPLYEVKQGTLINNTDSSVYDEIRYP